MEQTELIENIITIEHQARSMTDVADQIEKTFASSLQAEKEALRDKLQKETDSNLETYLAKEKESYEKKMQAIETNRAKKLAAMDAEYAQKKDDWVDQIFHRVIGDTGKQ